MAIAASLLPEFDQEMANTRKVLERIPDDKLDWQPHEKSMSFRSLGTHTANMLHWGLVTITEDSFDYAPGGEVMKEEPAESVQDLLSKFDANVTAMRGALETASDEALMQSWALLNNGEEVFKMPRIAVLRGMILNHVVHHRGQLTVYLRLNDLPLPAIYGPSADES